MRSPKNKIFDRLLVRGLFSFAIVSAGILAGLLAFQARTERAYARRYYCGVATTKMTEARLAFAKFLAEDLDELELYSESRTPNLANRMIALSSLKFALENIRTLSADSDLPEVDQTLSLLSEYSELNSRLTEELKSRGFGPWGLEGALNLIALDIERALDASPSEAFRRAVNRFRFNEYRFLLNRDHLHPEYVTSLEESLAELHKLAGSSPVLKVMAPKIEEYQKIFETYKQATYRIGVQGEGGLLEVLETKAQLLQEKLELLRNRASFEADSARSEFYRRMILLLAIALAFQIAAFYFLAREVTVPVGELTNAALQIESEGTHRHIPVRSKDEIGALTEIFNRMADTLLESRKIAELKAREAQTVSEALQVTQTQLVQAQKLEAIGTLAGGIAHDFNNILASLLGYISYLKEHLHDDSATLRQLSIMEQCAERGTDLIKKLMGFARREHNARQVIDLNEVLDETLTLISRTFGRNIRIEKYKSERLNRIEGDSTQLMQVLMNLAINSRDAMPEGGTLTFETENVYLDDLAGKLLSGLQAGSYVRLAVKDTGQGIPKELQHKIFDPFFTTKEVGKGTGLGLSTVYGICKSHGGSIRVTSEVGKGTQFEIFLPCLKQSSPQSREIDTSLLIGRRALLAISQGELRAKLQELLEIRGVVVDVASTVAEAMKLLHQGDELPSFLVTAGFDEESECDDIVLAARELSPGIAVVRLGADWNEKQLLELLLENS